MALGWRGVSASTAWLRMCRIILSEGAVRDTRGTKSREIAGYQSRVDMQRCTLVVPQRKLGYKFQAGEAWWILSGDNRVETIRPYSKTIANFSDDGVTFFGAYGVKVVDQLPYVVEKLRQDPQSRQAVINIWREKPPSTRDVPCTLSLQFLITEGQMDCIVQMRSSDTHLGWPYDVFNFSCITLAVILELGRPLELGTLVLTSGSQHIYDKDEGLIRQIVEDVPRQGIRETPRLLPGLFTGREDLVTRLKEWADGPGSLVGLERLNGVPDADD